jgi:hypothetical protein
MMGALGRKLTEIIKDRQDVLYGVDKSLDLRWIARCRDLQRI